MVCHSNIYVFYCNKNKSDICHDVYNHHVNHLSCGAICKVASMLLNGLVGQSILNILQLFLYVFRSQRLQFDDDFDDDILVLLAMTNNISSVILRIFHMILTLVKERTKKRSRYLYKPHKLIKLLHAYKYVYYNLEWFEHVKYAALLENPNFFYYKVSSINNDNFLDTLELYVVPNALIRHGGVHLCESYLGMFSCQRRDRTTHPQ